MKILFIGLILSAFCAKTYALDCHIINGPLMATHAFQIECDNNKSYYTDWSSIPKAIQEEHGGEFAENAPSSSFTLPMGAKLYTGAAKDAKEVLLEAEVFSLNDGVYDCQVTYQQKGREDEVEQENITVEHDKNRITQFYSTESGLSILSIPELKKEYIDQKLSLEFSQVTTIKKFEQSSNKLSLTYEQYSTCLPILILIETNIVKNDQGGFAMIREINALGDINKEIYKCKMVR